MAPSSQEKLQVALDRLRAEQLKAEKLGADIREERTSWEVGGDSLRELEKNRLAPWVLVARSSFPSIT